MASNSTFAFNQSWNQFRSHPAALDYLLPLLFCQFAKYFRLPTCKFCYKITTYLLDFEDRFEFQVRIKFFQLVHIQGCINHFNLWAI